VLEPGSIPARHVRIPGIMVDAVVVDPRQEQFYGLPYDETVSGARRACLTQGAAALPGKLERRIVARRAAMELRPGASLNFGFGMPGGIFGVIAEQGLGPQLWMSVEQGTHNGAMLDDHLFGAARNADAIVPSIEQFDYYSGGGIDIAFLGMGEADAEGNVNVSHLGGNLIGPGGFVEIAQNAKKVVFCGTFDAQGSRIAWTDGRLSIVSPGKVRKFVERVERITFSGEYARRRGQEVLYVTERAVLRLGRHGPALIEIAPGLDLERDVLRHMDFRPDVSELQEMPAESFG
jgi:acyl CoA:acetate/3-ketoacid CoA transferase